VADKDEVEPTEESSAPDPSSPDGRADTPQDPESEGSAFEVSDEPETAVEGDFAPETDAELTEDDEPADPDGIDPDGVDSDAVDPDDAEFDEIVRNSGVADTDSDAEGDDDGKVLEPAGVGAATASKAVRERRPPRAPKGTATGKRDQPDKRERTTPAKFVRQSVGELRKVVYPTGPQLIKYFVVVLVFVLFVIAYVSVLDLAFGAAIFKIFA
jgi:preprotein translocase subunit SecE